MPQRIIHFGFRIAWLFVLFFLGFYIATAFFIGNNVYVDTKAFSDSILVLGASSNKGNEHNPCLVARVKHAVNLKNEGYAKTLIFSGGKDYGRETIEAETMKEIAINEGTDEDSVVLEKKATSTYENIALSALIMKERGLTSTILVTEPFHAPRAYLVARKLGLHARVSPAIDSPCWTRWKYLSRYFLREPIAVIAYFLSGKL